MQIPFSCGSSLEYLWPTQNRRRKVPWFCFFGFKQRKAAVTVTNLARCHHYMLIISLFVNASSLCNLFMDSEFTRATSRHEFLLAEGQNISLHFYKSNRFLNFSKNNNHVPARKTKQQRQSFLTKVQCPSLFTRMLRSPLMLSIKVTVIISSLHLPLPFLPVLCMKVW